MRPILFGVVAVAQLTVDFLREPTADVADGDENIAELKDEVDEEVSASRFKFAFKYCCIELIEFCNYFEIKLFKVKLLKKRFVFPIITNDSLFLIEFINIFLLSCPCYEKRL